MSGRPPEEQIPTAELPDSHVQADEELKSQPKAEPERLSEAELDFVTADTQPLPSELAHMVEESASRETAAEATSETETKADEGEMRTETSEGSYDAGKFQRDTGGGGDALLDSGGLEGAASAGARRFCFGHRP